MYLASPFKFLTLFILLLFFGISECYTQITFRDNFSSSNYSNNDGGQTFSSNWVESNDDGSPTGDKIRITSGRLRFEDITRNSESILRSVNLTSTLSAVLTFDWETVSLDGSGTTSSEQLSIQVSTDGVTYTTLDKFTNSPLTGTFSQDITPYISATTTFRFYNESTWSYGDWESGEYVYIDNFLITGVPIPVFTSDVDSDGILDIDDLDNDNDGIPDCFEDGAENTTISDVFSINGDASQISSFEAQLTPDLNTQSGTMHITDKIDFNESFDFSFEAYLGSRDTSGADGIAIIFHNDPAGELAVGATGEGMGSQGIADGIVLELDTWNNGSFRGDIANDHGSIWDSDNQTGVGLLTTAVDLGNIEDNAWHDVRIIWNSATSTISYYLDATMAGTFTNDIINNYFGGENLVYFGFTASTGGSRNDQRIRFNDLCEIPLFVDDDGDGIPNYLDLDSDNDGIFDVIEGGDGALDTNFDGRIDAADIGYSDSNSDGQADSSVSAIETPNSDTDTLPDFIDPDSDDDGCFDAIEAAGSFTSADVDINGGLTGGVETSGLPTVVNPSGQARTVAVLTAGITNISTQPSLQTTIAGGSAIFSIAATGNGTISYQWEESINGGVSWTSLSNGGSNPSYSGASTNSLTLSGVPLTYNTYQYRVILENENNVCLQITSSTAELRVNVGSVITNRRITYRVKKN